MKLLWLLLVGTLTLVVLLGVNQYFFCPHFSFPPPSPFQGNRLYNPYRFIVPSHWIKCNFHAHSRAWRGITNGQGSASDVHRAYQNLHYSIHCVSNYQKIDTVNCINRNYIPVYEHGYNLRKVHQLVLGEYHVEWIDYLLPQTIHNKQDVLNHLKKLNALVILNHPALRHGYLASDVSALTNYDGMEVLNPAALSTGLWDAALSAGRNVFVVGDDDIHDIWQKGRLGTMCTFVNVPKNNGKLVLNALRTGQSYGVIIGKDQPLDSIPFLTRCQVCKHTVTIQMSQSAAEITITAQNGRIVRTFKNLATVTFPMAPQYHYARATCTYANGTRIFLNPAFFVHDTDHPSAVVQENVLETTVYRVAGALTLCVYFFLLANLFKFMHKTGYAIPQ